MFAVDAGDRSPTVDLTFGIDDRVQVVDVLDDWTNTLIDQLDGVHLVDLEVLERSDDPSGKPPAAPSTRTWWEYVTRVQLAGQDE